MSGGIIYGLVSRGTVVLAEYAKANGNFMQVCRLILQKLDTSLNTRASYAYDAYFFHYICENGLIYMCMTDATLRKTLAYMYLDDIKTRFTSKYGGYAADAPAYRFNDEFSRVLQTQSVYWSTNNSADKVGAVRSQIENTKEVLVQNIEKLLARGEQIELLVEKTSRLEEQAIDFKHVSGDLKKHMWWKNVKLWIILGVVLVVVAFLIFWFSCGIDFRCVRGGGDAPVAAPSNVPIAAPVA